MWVWVRMPVCVMWWPRENVDYLLCWLVSVISMQTRVTRKRNTQFRNCPFQAGLWVCLYDIFLIND